MNNDEYEMMRVNYMRMEKELKAARQTLLDDFAKHLIHAAVLKAIHNLTIDGVYHPTISWDEIAESAYDAAESLLEERDKRYAES